MSETAEAAEVVEREETSDRVKPWTVKGIAPEERNAAIAAADRQDMTIGEWLTRAIRTQVQSDHQADRAPVPVEKPYSPTSDRQSDLAVREQLVAIRAGRTDSRDGSDRMAVE